MAATCRLLIESLEDRRVLSVNTAVLTNKLVSVQDVGTGVVAVEMEVTNPTSCGGTTTNAAPQATGVMEVAVAGLQYTVALPTAFTDLETNSADLVFAVVGNTNPAMFDKVAINSSGNLMLDIAGDVNDLAVLTIMATDADGATATTDLDVVGTGHDDEPISIDGFTGHRDPNDPEQWTFEGNVSGSGDNSDVTIQFGGDLDGHTTDVESDGSFTFTGVVPESGSGQVTVQAISGNGNSSPIVIFDLDDDD